MRTTQASNVRPLTIQLHTARVLTGWPCIRPVLCTFALLLTLVPAPDAVAEVYLSYFYTPADAIVFMPEAGTAVTLRNSSEWVVWKNSSTLSAGEVEDVTGLVPGFHRVTSNKKVVLMAGDMVTGSGTNTRSYYARDVDGNAVGTELYTYLRSSAEEDTPKLFVFSHQDSNTVTVTHTDEFGWETVWTGSLADGARQDIALGFSDHIKITSTYPVSALVAGSDHYDDPGAHCVPATSSGTFFGDEFSTWVPGGEVYVYSFADGTHVDLRNTVTIDPTPRVSWDLNKGEVGSYAIPGDQSFAITVQATKPIVMCRMYQDLSTANGMHYIPAKSGTMIGTDFIIDANDPIEIIAYQDGTLVEYTRRNGTVHSYTLAAGGHQVLPAGTAGRLTAVKAVSVVSRALIGATFVPIPVTALDTAPGPPAVFAVRHDPPSPTVYQTVVVVSWATDEPCTSCVSHRRNGGPWSLPICLQAHVTQHSIPIDISSSSADDLVEYSVSSTDKDNNTVVNDNNGQYYPITITDFVPQLSVSRLSALPPSSTGGPYTVNLMVENTGIAEARNIQIRERLTGMISPTAATSLVPITARELDLIIPVPNTPAGGLTFVSYELIPMLYSSFSTFGVGISTSSTVSYGASGGQTFSETFSSPVTFSSSGALSWIRTKDYVVATNIGRLTALNTAANTGTLLEEAARFALARDAVVAELETTDRYAIEKLVNTSWNGRLGYIGFGGWRFLLLLGHQAVIPSFNMEHKCTAYDPYKAPIADNIYADVITGDDYKPEVIIGRLPGERADLLLDQLQNSLTPISTDRTVLMSGTGDGEGDFVDSIDHVDGFLGQYTTHVKRHWKDVGDDPTRLNNFRSDAPNTDLFVFRGHGDTTSWNDSTVQNIDAVFTDFGSKHPMVWSIACTTGDLSGYSMAEAFIQGGASLFIGAADKSSRSPNDDFAHYLAKYHTMSTFYPTIGEVFKWAKRKLIDENIHWNTWCYIDARNKQIVNGYNLYGDPKRGLAPLTKTTPRPLAAVAGEGPPPTEIELFLPDYVVTTTEGGTDYVTFPAEEGGTLEEEGQPIVPTYIHRVAFGPEYKIRDLTLEGRGGLETESGLSLPIASFAEDDGTPLAPRSPAKESSTFPPPEARYTWRAEEQLDGSHVLILSVFPFYYDSATTQVEFYRNHVFSVSWNRSDTAITRILPDEDVFVLGDPITGTVDINHASRESVEATLEVDLLDDTTGAVVESMDPQAFGLGEGTASLDFGVALEATEPTVYLLRARLMSIGDLLDEATTRVRVGRLSVIGEALAVMPDAANGFEIGQLVTATAWFESTCDNLVTGLTSFKVVDVESASIIHEQKEGVELDSGATHQAEMVWDTSSVGDGTYRISAVFEYDGVSTDPMTADLFTLRHMGVTLATDRLVYDVGDKVVVWAGITTADGEPLEVSPTLWLALPDASSAPIQLSYLSTLGIYSGWHYLAAGSPDGPYGIALSADATGYHPGSAQHFFSVGGAPPEPGFTWSPLTPETGETVQFTDTSTGDPVSWVWGFGDGAAGTSQNPTHAYDGPGEREVTLGVTNAYGTSWVSEMVTVMPGEEEPIFSDGFETGDLTAWSASLP